MRDGAPFPLESAGDLFVDERTGVQTPLSARETSFVDEEIPLQIREKAAEIAREFGKQASEIVTKAGGDLARMEFSGEDTEAQSRSATAAQTDARARIAAIEQDLRDPRLGDRERTELQSSLQQLNDSLSSAQTSATLFRPDWLRRR